MFCAKSFGFHLPNRSIGYNRTLRTVLPFPNTSVMLMAAILTVMLNECRIRSVAICN